MQNISGCLCAGENSPIGLLGETDNAVEEGRCAELSPRVEQGTDPAMRGRASLSQKHRHFIHSERKAGTVYAYR